MASIVAAGSDWTASTVSGGSAASAAAAPAGCWLLFVVLLLLLLLLLLVLASAGCCLDPEARHRPDRCPCLLQDICLDRVLLPNVAKAPAAAAGVIRRCC